MSQSVSQFRSELIQNNDAGKQQHVPSHVLKEDAIVRDPLKEHVVCLDVAVNHIQAMEISDSIHQL